MATRRMSGPQSRSTRNAILSAKAVPPQATERLTALSIMYQVERQDKANNVLAGLTLIAAALAYLGIAALLLGDAKLLGGSWAPAFLAFPLWIAASFQALLVWSGLDISKSAKVLEQRLVSSLGFDDAMTTDGGARAAGQAFSTYGQPAALKIQSLVCYGGIWAIILVFSVVCLAVAARGAGWISPPVIAAEIVYALLLTGNAAAWLHISKHTKEASAR